MNETGHLLKHVFVSDAWKRDACDAKLDDGDGRIRTCGRRLAEHLPASQGCAHCQKPLSAAQVRRKVTYCSYSCGRKASAKDKVTRFWSLIRKSEGCWEWTGAVTRGYGRLSGDHGEPAIAAHRFSWELHNGPIPEGKMVCHHCDNRRCVRPDHLFLGTAADNAADRDHKGRLTNPKGSATAAAKLTEAAVVEIRRRYAEGGRGGNRHAKGGVTMQALADEYGVAVIRISEIVRGLSWKHVPEGAHAA